MMANCDRTVLLCTTKIISNIANLSVAIRMIDRMSPKPRCARAAAQAARKMKTPR